MFSIYEMNEEKEERMWKNAIFIFDTCALHDFYFLKKDYRSKIFEEVFKKNKDRFWIPGHVEFEFLKNRDKIIKKPVHINYDKLENELKSMSKSLNVKGVLKTIIESTKKDDKHPHIEQNDLNALEKELDEFLKKVKEFEKNIIDKIEIAKDEILDVKKNDDVKDAIYEYFDVGKSFTFDEIIEITKEGKHRYEFKIPPGYGDFYKKDKKGTQIFGDLIIWKEILQYSKEKKKDIIFITNDVLKDEDWCEIDKKKRIERPRLELIKEINDHSNIEFWMYNLEQFLHLSKEYLQSTFTQEDLDEIVSSIKNSSYHEYLEIECNHCGNLNYINKEDIDFHFEHESTDNRGMGPELQYSSYYIHECDDCLSPLDIRFFGCEYPVGAINYTDIEVSSGNLVRGINFEDKLEKIVVR